MPEGVDEAFAVGVGRMGMGVEIDEPGAHRAHPETNEPSRKHGRDADQPWISQLHASRGILAEASGWDRGGCRVQGNLLKARQCLLRLPRECVC